MRYATARAFRTALEDRIKHQASGVDADILRLRRSIAFERLLVRLAHSANPSWVLKGGTALEVRFGHLARATRDVDLAFRGTQPADDAADELIAAIASDHQGDLFDFEVTEQTELSVTGLRGPVVRLSVTARLDGRVFERFVVDLVSSEGRPVPADTVAIGHGLAFAELPTVEIPVLDLHVHFAEKLDAFTHEWTDRVNTRVKDLVDMVLLIDRGLLPSPQLVRAVTVAFADKARTAPGPDLPPPPAEWADEFTALADAVELSVRDVATGHARLQSFWRDALATTSDPQP